MRRTKPAVVIQVSGGVAIYQVFPSNGARVVLIDYDNLKESPTRIKDLEGLLLEVKKKLPNSPRKKALVCGLKMEVEAAEKLEEEK